MCVCVYVCQLWDLRNELRCVFSLMIKERNPLSSRVTALSIQACFLTVPCCHQALRIEYAACIFRAVIISRPSAFFFLRLLLLVKQSALAYVILYQMRFLSWTCNSPRGATRCIHTEDLPTCPHGTADFHMCGKNLLWMSSFIQQAVWQLIYAMNS